MPRVPFDELPQDARLWVFGVSRGLEPREEEALLGAVDGFLQDWRAHGSPLTAAREWRYGRFLLIGVDEATAPPSGCSIDALVRVLKATEAELEVSIVDHAPVFYRVGQEVRRVDRAEFRRLAEAGAVDPDTVVFDNTITRVGKVRAGEWERPAREAWHARAFFRKTVPG